MDHVWQIGHLGPPESEMLEAYTTLGYVAGKTERVRLLTAVVTAVVYRDPGLLAKAVTTLDVLSGGRAMLGIGAAWSEEKARGLGLFFPPPLSGWSDWRRRSTSAGRCGATTTARSKVSTTDWTER
jgi:alkanesulfonate monooxygenase SsuD/methylene tetrahydromethanopterin reductase-like flavin-dependent oxidoreductase (luciferase family)